MRSFGDDALAALKRDIGLQPPQQPDLPDDFDLPNWVVDDLVDHAIGGPGTLAGLTCWDPCCRRGHLATALRGHFGSAQASDAVDVGQDAHEFLKGRIKRDAVDWLITQPPRGKVDPFVLRALQTARLGVAVLVHTPVHGSLGPRLKVFEKHPPTIYAPLGCTVPLLKSDSPNSIWQTASFTWLVWLKGEMGPSKPRTIPGPEVTPSEIVWAEGERSRPDDPHGTQGLGRTRRLTGSGGHLIPHHTKADDLVADRRCADDTGVQQPHLGRIGERAPA